MHPQDADPAELYEQLFVPALFEEWAPRLLLEEECAPRLLDAAPIRPGDRILDLACGTGLLARTAAERTEPDGHVTGFDDDPTRLALAARLAPHIEWRHGDTALLPFGDRRFDAVLSLFGLASVADPHATLREVHRVLRPTGRLALAL